MIVYREVSTLAKDLGISAETLYAVSNRIDRHYRRVDIARGDGTCRQLSVPDGQLKRIQRSILSNLLVHMPISDCACAYRYGSSTKRAALPHVGRQMVLHLDISHFFDSIKYSDVKNMAFPPSIYAEPVRILLSILCYYNDGLPQGAPTSPAISNIILRGFDNTVKRWCTLQSIRYTRYCDDMVFSGKFNPDKVTRFVAKQLRKLGLFLNPNKTTVRTPSQRQCVTGLVVNDKVSVPAQYRRSLRQQLYYCRRFGIEEHLTHIRSQEPPIDYIRSLLGKVNYVLQVSPENIEMREYRDWLKLELTRRLRRQKQSRTKHTDITV